MSQPETRAHALFGGALTMRLPASFASVSEIRQVPDNQEVFVDQASDASLILELLELERGRPGPEAARHFFQDLAESNEAQEAAVLYQGDITATAAPHLRAYPKQGLVGVQTVAKFRSSDAPLLPVRVYLANIRLEQVGTDLLLTLNLPPSAQGPPPPPPAASEAEEMGPQVFSKNGPRPDALVVALQEALDSLQVLNWGLFG